MYSAPERKPLVELFARLAVAFARGYAAVFREVWPFCALWPAPWFFGMRLLVRYDDVVEALGRADVFKVPFGDEMKRLNDGIAPPTAHQAARLNNVPAPGTPFLLGIDDPPGEHARQARYLMKQLGLDEIDRVVNLARDAAEARLPSSATVRFEAIRGLITAVPIDLCNSYFGLSVGDHEADGFAAASIELSGHLFGPPPIKPSKHGQEDRAGDHVRCFVERAIQAAQATSPANSGSVPQNLATKLRSVSHEEMRAILMGMIVGFVPTNTMAGGYILDVLLHRPKAMAMAVAAAKSGDDDRLWQCLIEALRLRPINLGPFRKCERRYQFDGFSIPAGSRVWVMTGSAMCDSRKVLDARKFDPERVASSYLHFGFGMHWCIGAMLAKAQLTQTFKALLRRGAPTAESDLTYRGTFPDTLTISIPRVPQ